MLIPMSDDLKGTFMLIFAQGSLFPWVFGDFFYEFILD